MKKLLYLLFVNALFIIANDVISQTLVSTTPSKKNVIFEEFTGVG